MPEFLFRGRSIDGGWIYGNLHTYTNRAYICYESKTFGRVDEQVDMKTVSRFTGLYDKNDKKIFEGDILAYSCGLNIAVEYIRTYARFAGVNGQSILSLEDMNKENRVEVIGNIYENPELMSEDKKELKAMENKPLIIVVGGEIEDEKKKVIDDIKKENSDISFLEIINQEANCHPKKQSLSAENFARRIAVKEQNAIMTTNSFHFLEAFLFYLQKYEAYNGNVHFYLVENGNVKKSDNSHDIMKNLSQPAFDLANERLAYEMEGNNEDDDEECDE